MARIRVNPQQNSDKRKHVAMRIHLPEVCRFKFVSSPMTRTAQQFAEAIGQAHRVEVASARGEKMTLTTKRNRKRVA